MKDIDRIIDANGWDLEKEIPEYDWGCLQRNIKIPLNYGVGIIMSYDGKMWTTQYNAYRKHKECVVICEIHTWKGISGDAIHYYGDLKIQFPDFTEDGNPGHTVSNNLPMFSTYKITLYDIVEEYQKKRWPHNYEHYRVGSYCSGFISIAAVERRAKEVFEQMFEEGWKLKFDRRY